MTNDSAYKVAVAVVPKPASFLSIIGSYVVIREVLADHRLNRGKPLSRLLVAVSTADIVFSLGWFLGTWPSPKELDHLVGNVGNKQTCTFQGALVQFGFQASPLFNTCLAFFCLLIVKHNYTDSQLRAWEPWVHGIIWMYSTIATIVPIPFGMYNNNWEVCWIDSSPIDCKDSFTYGDDADCERGDNAWIWGLSFTVFAPWTCALVSVSLLLTIWRTVRGLENKSLNYAGTWAKRGANRDLRAAADTISSQAGDNRGPERAVSAPSTTDQFQDEFSRTPTATTEDEQLEAAGEEERQAVDVEDSLLPPTASQKQRQERVNRKKSTLVAKQTAWFTVAFLLTYALDFVSTVLWYAGDTWNDVLDSIAYALLPLQGLFNFLIFARTRVGMRTFEGRLLRRLFFEWCCCKSFSRRRCLKSSRSSRDADNFEAAPGAVAKLKQELKTEPLCISGDSRPSETIGTM